MLGQVLRLSLIVLGVAASAGQVFAQVGLEGLSDPSEALEGISISGGGWSQWRNAGEIQLFLLDVATTIALTAMFVYHPIRRRLPVTLDSLRLPPLFYLYALIGMVVGFLVVQHGYIIGFVVFGIGALLRFRSNLDDPEDTVEMILVTVLGLCVGLDLPIMAIAIGVVSWVVVLVAARRDAVEIEVKAEDHDTLEAALARIREVSQQNRWRVAREHRSHAKPSADVILVTIGKLSEAEAERALDEPLRIGGVSWKLTS